MAVQVSYPGVYIEEFTPGAPIEGVGTSTAAFIGTAESGPIDEPRLIQSWDAFEAMFGKFISSPSTGYLGPAVYGFFQNGGTTCYVVRHGAGVHSSVRLEDRQTGTNPPALIATALQEGKAGDSLTVKVEESSILADMLGGGVTSLKGQRAETDIQGINSSDRMTLTVADHTGFAPGDSVMLTDKNNKTAPAVIASLGANIHTLVVSSSLDTTNLDFSQGKVRTADITAGRRTFRLVVPATLTLGTALPSGAAIKIFGYETDVAANRTPEFCTVESAGGDTLTVTAPLKHTFILSDPNKVPTVESLEFDLTVRDTATGNSEPPFKRLAMNPKHPNYWRTSVTSRLIQLTLPKSPNFDGDLRPNAQLYNLTGGQPDNSSSAWNEIQNDPDKYLNLFKPIDEISLICIPGATEAKVQKAVRDHCETMADRFAILDSTFDANAQTIPAQWGDVISAKGYAALYFPWILAHNFVRDQDEFWPPSGHIAGIYARTDANPGVHKAPANAAIRGALGLQQRLTDTEQGPLNLKGINVLRVFQGQGQPIVWGARTTATDRNWQYVNVRRLFIFLEESIEEGDPMGGV